MDLVDMGWDVADWNGLDQDKEKWRDLVNAMMNIPIL
jgi:hypothetical protein